MTRICPRCRAEYQDWVQTCPDCHIPLGTSQPVKSEEDEMGPDLSIEFTLLSGETVSVRDQLPETATEATVQAYAKRLIALIGNDSVQTFTYWWQGEYYVDAVRMREVAAISVSTSSEDDDSEEWEE